MQLFESLTCFQHLPSAITLPSGATENKAQSIFICQSFEYLRESESALPQGKKTPPASKSKLCKVVSTQTHIHTWADTPRDIYRHTHRYTHTLRSIIRVSTKIFCPCYNTKEGGGPRVPVPDCCPLPHPHPCLKPFPLASSTVDLKARFSCKQICWSRVPRNPPGVEWM